MLVFEHTDFPTSPCPCILFPECGVHCSLLGKFEVPQLLGLLTWSQRLVSFGEAYEHHTSYPPPMILMVVVLKRVPKHGSEDRWKAEIESVAHNASNRSYLGEP